MLQLILLILHVITEVNNLFWCFWGNPDKHHFFQFIISHKLDLVQGGSLWELASYFILKKNWKNIYQISAKNNNLHIVILLKIKSPNRVIPCKWIKAIDMTNLRFWMKVFQMKAIYEIRLSWKFQHKLVIHSKVMTPQIWHSKLETDKTKQWGSGSLGAFLSLKNFLLYLNQSSGDFCTVSVPEGL